MQNRRSVAKFRFVFLAGLACLMAVAPISILAGHKTGSAASAAPLAASPNVTVDFTTVQRTLSPLAISMDESHYGGASNMSNDANQQAAIRRLKVPMMRLDLAYATPGNPASQIVCYAGGCDQSIPGINWVNGVRAAGAEPEIKVRISNAMPQQYWASDAANEVTYFNKTPGITPVKRWIVGNEPDINGLNVTTYSNGFVSIYNAMKAVDPTIKIGGPAAAFYDRAYIQSFLNILKSNGITPDFVDWHQYGEGGSVVKTDADLLSNATASYETNGNDLRSLISSIYGPAAANIEIEMGEWNLSWSGDGRQLTNFNTVWAASAQGHMLNAGLIGRQYSDKNGPLGAVCDAGNLSYGGTSYSCGMDGPLPLYHGLGMFTGESLFPGFGLTLVPSTVSLANVDVFASNNPKNIVVVNKDPSATQPAVFSLTGVTSGSVTVWQKGPSNPTPTNVGTVGIASGSFSYSLAPYTVYTFLVNSGTVVGTPTATSTPSSSSPTPTATRTPVPSATPTTPAGTPIPPSGSILAWDTFQRPDQAFWGTAADGHAWAGDANALGVFAVVSGGGEVAGANAPVNAVLGPQATDSEVAFNGSMSSYGTTNIGAVLRWQDTNNWYKAYIDGTNLVLQRKVAGAYTVLGTAPFAASGGTLYSLRFRTAGNTLSARVWQAGTPEPSTWMVTVTDGSLAAGFAGLRIQVASGVSARYASFLADVPAGSAVGTPTPTPTVNPNQDSDGDGYPDALEISLGKNPYSYCPIMRADVNMDGVVNNLDVAKVALAFGQPIPPGNARLDQNADDVVNLLDLSLLTREMGRSVTSCP